MRTSARHVLLPLAAFLMIVPMQVDIGSFRLNTSLATMLGLSAAYFADQVAARRPLGREHRLFAILFLLLTYFLAVSVLGQARDFLVVQMCVYGIIMYAAALVIARGYRRLYGDGWIATALRSIFLLGIVHAAIQFAVLLVPSISSAVYSVVALTEDSAAHISQGYRSPGLFSSGAAILGTFNAWMLAIGAVAFLGTRERARPPRLLAMAVAVLLEIGAIAISGRTGFVTMPICLAAVWAYSATSDRRSRLGRNLGLTLLGSALIVALAAFTVSTDNIEQNLRWSFEFLYSLSEGRGLETGSTSVLFEQMFFLPDGWFPLLFGTSNFGRSPDFPYVDSDVGYVLMVFGGGVVGTLLMMSVFVYIVAEALHSRQSQLSALLIAFVATLFVVNMKDFYFIQNSGVSQLLVLCFAMLIASGRSTPSPAFRSAGAPLADSLRDTPQTSS